MTASATTPSPAAWLADLPCGTQVCVDSVIGTTQGRLHELGLRPGVVVRILHKTHGGGRLLAFDGSRIAVSAAGAREIRGAPVQ